MQNLKMFCICIHNELLSKVKKIDYIPVGLGNNKFDSEWIKDNSGENISEKNKFYGEYTFHYWFWKNEIKNISDNDWIGFCAYRRFWLSDKKTVFSSQKKDFLSHIPDEWNKYNVILGPHFYINKMKLSKLFKHSFRSLVDNPAAIFEKNRNIKFQFNSFHGFGNLDKAIDLLDDKNREDFRKFTEKNNSFNMGNMFICNSKKIINDYYNSLFPWLKRCESIFGFNSNSYGKTRIYGFLAERYLPYWFNKYTKPLIWPIIFYDINSNQIK